MSIPARSGLFSYFDGSTELEGYLAYPSGASASPRPVVLVAHAWGGQDEFARSKAHMLADLGYIGLAIDVYGKGRRGSSPEENSKLMTPWVQDRGALRTRLLAAASAARTVDGGTVAGQELIDRFWGGLVRWAVVDQPKLAVEIERPILHRRVMAHPNGAAIWAEYEAAA